MRYITSTLGALLALFCGSQCNQARAADLTLPVGGKVTIEFIFSDASFSNTLSLVTPSATVAITGCKLVDVSPFPGVALSSAKISQRGCRITLDSDGNTAGIQGFPAGTVFSFRLCADNNGDKQCDNVWSSNPASNSDGKEHVKTTPLGASGNVFQMAWEDEANLGDSDFNDFIATVRVDADSDGDGLWDDWETVGIDTNGDGVIDLDLPALGANPNHKDLFVEVDYMDCAVSGGDCGSNAHSHRPKDAAINAVIAAFANANVTNPDGINGITLHVDVSNAVKHQNNLNINGLCFQGGSGIGSFDAVKADPANFGPNNPRRFAYHYSLWTHQQTSTTTSSGCAELPGNDFQVALGGWNVGQGDVDGDGLSDDNVGTIQQQAGTFMHELGHNLNLGHGGGDSVNFKPNYVSIMSYRYQISGIPPTDPDGVLGPLTGRVDYSRAQLADLSETNLNEATGIGGSADTAFWNCPGGGTNGAAGNGPLDWNCNGDTKGTGLTVDINNDGVNNTLTGFADWANIKFDFQNSAGFEDGDHTSAPVQEIDYPTFLQTIAADLKIVATAGPNPAVTGSNVTYTINVTNLRSGAAFKVVVSDNLPSTVLFASCSATGGGVCGGSGNNRTITFPTIVGGATATITLVGTVDCPVPNGASISNTAAVSSTPADADSSNNSATVTVTASNPPPVISGISVDKPSLGPPNHKMVDVTVNYVATDNCGVDTCVLSVSSNEPVDGTGDGDTSPDWVIVDAHHVQLRAERAGNGTGRVYTISITCTDSANNSTVRTTTVVVPH
uniref:Conserved repeat domain n=1 Tax=Solibacter usitatus (strain Ellin6076) TaxID=234267 RepID=Q01X81_SOLUE